MKFREENFECPIKQAITNIVLSKCPLLFINNNANGIHLQPNQLIPEVKVRLKEPKMTVTSLSDHEDDHEPAELDKLPTFEKDFQQPEKRLVMLETSEEIQEAQRKDPYIPKLLKILEQKQISTISSVFYLKTTYYIEL
uniref:Uncharacterized protein n=1 Tax=Romanomermis culicivorax TaxID=13658 RepID=A0A915HVD8_ROMCU